MYFRIVLLIAAVVWAQAGFVHSNFALVKHTQSAYSSSADTTVYAQFSGMNNDTLSEDDDVFDEDAAYEEAFSEEYDDSGDLDDLQIFVPEDNAAVGASQDQIITDTTNADGIEYVERPEEDLLIVEVVVDAESILSAGVIVYVDEDSNLWLPLSVMTELMQFPINVNPGTGEVEGWFIEEQNKLIMKPPYDVITYKGETLDIVAANVENQVDDIFITEALFEQLFPVDINLNFNELRIYLETEEDLPFQVLAQRRAKWQQASRQSNQPGRYLDGEVIRLPYRKFSYPTIQVNHSVNASKSAGNDVQNSTVSTVQTQGDFLGMDLRSNGSFSTNSDGNNEFNNFNFTFSKEDYDAKLLGRLQASRFELGDVNGNSLALASGFQRGRGFSVTNAPLNFIRDPNNFIVEGFGPVGWDVEVYQDVRLLAFDTIDSDGRYEFDALPLRQGFNLFRIVLYGPSGEREERFERFYLGQNMVDEGEFIYDVTLLESSTPLFDPSRNPVDETSGTVSLQGDYGLTENVSLNAGIFQGPNNGTLLRGVGGGARISSGSLFSQFNVFQTDSKARSFNAEATGNLTQDIYWNAGQTLHLDYEPGVRTFERDTFASITKNFSLNLIPQGALTFGIRDQKLDSGVNTRTYNNRISGQFWGTNFTNTLDYTTMDNSDDQWQGSLTARRRVPLGNLRGRLNYSLQNPAEFQSADLQLQSRLNERFTFNGLLTSSFIGEKEQTLQGNVDVKFDKFRLGFTASASTEDNYRAGFTLAYNFIPQSLQGDYKITGDTSDLNSGLLLVRPYLDENQNNIYDEGEDVVEGLEFRNMLTGKRATADANGIATLPGLSPAIVNRITVNQQTYPDIYLVADKQDLNVYGKRGIGGPIDYRLNKLGEITGMIYVGDNETGELVPLPGVVLYLIDAKGDVYQESYSEFDGFYSFTSVPAGTYKIYFPKSNALNAVFGSEGFTDPFEITFDRIEIFDADFEITPHRIIPLGDTIEGDIVSEGLELTESAANDSPLRLKTASSSNMPPRAPLENGFFTMVLAPVSGI